MYQLPTDSRFFFLVVLRWEFAGCLFCYDSANMKNIDSERSLDLFIQVSLLKKYEAERKLENIAMMAVLDGIQKAYSVDFGPLNILRAAAFHGANYILPLKRSIISYASGEQRLPIFS